MIDTPDDVDFLRKCDLTELATVTRVEYYPKF